MLIESTRAGVVKSHAGDQPCIWVRFAGVELPLAFKATHAKMLVQIYGKPAGDTAAWPGKWITLCSEMVNDPSRGKGALCEAVRLRPDKPTSAQIADAEGRLGKKPQPPASSAAPRDQAADMKLVDDICTAIGAATSREQIDEVLAPHLEESKLMEPRLVAIVVSTRKARLAELAAGVPVAEGKPDA